MDATEVPPVARFLAHSFATDTEYQQGMAGILSSGVLEGKSEKEKRDITLRSEVFYFNRITGFSLTVEEASSARESAFPSTDVNAVTSAMPSQEEQQPATLTFAQLKELIEQGRTDEIPNNKVIPNVLSSDVPSESRTEVRKKPWEISQS